MTRDHERRTTESRTFEQSLPRGSRRRSSESYPLRGDVRPIMGLDEDPVAYSAVVVYERADGETTRTIRRFANAQEARGFVKRALASYHPDGYRRTKS